MNTAIYLLACPAKNARRVVVPAASAFLRACHAERPPGEGYFSANTFTADIAAVMFAQDGSTERYKGPCSSSYVWADFDNAADPDDARRAASTLCRHLGERYDLGDDDILCFLSGGKGYHVGIPAALFQMEPHPEHPARLGALVARWTADAGIGHPYPDWSIYEHLRLFRARNSFHPGGGVYKVRVAVDHLGTTRHADIVDYAERPRPFDPPPQPGPHDVALADWAEAVARPARPRGKMDVDGRRVPPEGVVTGRITPATWAWIKWGDDNGRSRHDALRFASANLAELCPPEGDALADALLRRGCDRCGLDPDATDVRREVDRGRRLIRGDGNP